MKTVRIHLDAWIALDPADDFPGLLLEAIARMPRLAPTDLRVLCLAEPADGVFFQALAQDEIRLPGDIWRIAAWDPTGGVKIRHLPGHSDLWILAGRRIATAEGLDIHALMSDQSVPERQPAADIVRAIAAAGGLPALAWSPAFGFFGRGAGVHALVRQFAPQELAFIDTAARPGGWPTPRLYAAARKAARAVLAGTGPHGQPGTYTGSFSIPPPTDPAQIIASLKTALSAGPSAITLSGSRQGAWSAWRQSRPRPPRNSPA